MKKVLISERIVFAGLLLMLWVYLWLRAIYVPAAFDEAATFFYYVHTGDFLPFLSHWDVNNHYLNSFLAWISCSMFGPSLLALRLPNLLFAPLFFYFVWKISEEFQNRFLRISFFVILCFTHSFSEFFAISRGYGMSMALLTGAVWCMIQLSRTYSARYYFLVLIMTALAVSANLTLINTFVLVIFLLCLLLIKDPGKLNSKILKGSAIIVLGILPLLFNLLFIFALRKNGNLWAGSPEGFWHVTVNSLLKLLTGSSGPVFSFIMAVYSLLTAGIVLYFILSWKKIRELSSATWLFLILLAGNITTTVILRFTLKVNYPEDRLALYFFPLFLGSLFFLLDSPDPAIRKWLLPVLVIPFYFFPMEFFHRMNLNYLSFYVSDNLPGRFYDRIYSGRSSGKSLPVVGGEKGRHFCWAYLDFLHGGKLGEIYFSDFPGHLADYQIADIRRYPGWRKWYDTIDHDPYGERYLLKRRYAVDRHQIARYDGIRTSKETEWEFLTLYEGRADTLSGKNLGLSLEIQITSPAVPLVAWFVATVGDSTGKDIRYERYPLDWHRTEWKDTDNIFKYTFILNDLPPGSRNVKLYFWNIGKQPVSFSEGSIRIDELR